MANIPQFRLWHRPTQAMYLVKALFLHTNSALVTPFDGDGRGMHVSLLTGQSILMQFSGIVDSYDKPIYEGDIVEWHHLYDEDEVEAGEPREVYPRDEVVLRPGGYCFFDKDYPNDSNPLLNYNSIMSGSNKLYKWICGNVYERPDWHSLSEKDSMRPDLVIRDEVDEPEPAEASI